MNGEERNPPSVPRLVSLFSGAGGLDWGFHALGFALELASDRKPDAGATYAANYGVPLDRGPCVPSGAFWVGDVASLRPCASGFPEVSLLLGGPPCQDFSVVRGPEGKRRGAKTLRGKLYLHYARFLALYRPLAFVFENVPGLASSNGGADLRTILEDFRHLDELPRRWEEQWRMAPGSTPPPPEDLLGLRGIPRYLLAFHGVVDAAAHGVPQRRKRLLLVGVREDLPLGPHHRRALAEALAGSPALRKYPLSAMEALEGAVLVDLVQAYRELRRAYGEMFPGGEDPVADYLRLHGGEAHDPLFAQALEAHGQVLRAMGWWGRPLAGVPEDFFPDGSHALAKESPAVRERLWRIPPGANHRAVEGTPHAVRGRGLSLIYRRLHPLLPAPTVVAHGGGGTWGYHYRRERGRLTNRERARLQSFPDGFLFSGSGEKVRAQIGEAVPPLLSLALAEALVELLESLGQGVGRVPAPLGG